MDAGVVKEGPWTLSILPSYLPFAIAKDRKANPRLDSSSIYRKKKKGTVFRSQSNKIYRRANRFLNNQSLFTKKFRELRAQVYQVVVCQFIGLTGDNLAN